MSLAPVRLATRVSPLALWQAEHVAGLLQASHPEVEVEVVRTDTIGDRRQDVPISEIGGKGVFATEVQALVLDGRADAAVHSAKDLPGVTGAGLALVAAPGRGDPRDALVGGTVDGLPPGATVATGSQRRRVQLAALRPDLRFVELRGNMATRLGKVGAPTADGRTIDAIVVAAAALERLGLAERIAERLPVDRVVPQVGQGTLAVEVRADDPDATALLSVVEDPASRRRLDAERAFLAELGGDCDLPAGAHATVAPDGTLHLRAVLADAGERVHRAEASGPDGPTMGIELARSLRAAVEGADEAR